jgi:ribosome-binding factor A
VDQFLQNKTYLKIGEKTNCKINVHDSDDSSNGNVFFSVTGTYEARSNALEMLRNETGRLGVIVSVQKMKHNVSNPLSFIKKF